jgi:hypothetical protein
MNTNVIASGQRQRLQWFNCTRARGAKNYENVIVFEQSYANQIFLDKIPEK